MPRKDKLFLAMPTRSSFLMADLEIFTAEYDVVVNSYAWRKKQWTLWFFIRQFFQLIWHLPKTKVIVIQFGGYWGLLPILLGKLWSIPSFVILHGTDCAKIERISFGSLRTPLLRWSCKKVYQNANLLLPVSASLMSTNNTYNEFEQLQGVHHHFPAIKTPYHVIPNGLDLDFWTQGDPIPTTNNQFIAVFTMAQFQLKGGPLIVEMAKRFPECTFRIAGIAKSEFQTALPDNLELLGRLDKNQLKKAYQKAQFHLQLSVFEGFGLSLCEAMLCECVPIGSSVNAIPEIIGLNGYILEQNNADQLETIIQDALNAEDLSQKGKAAKQSIINRFGFDNRKNEMLKTLRALQ